MKEIRKGQFSSVEGTSGDFVRLRVNDSSFNEGDNRLSLRGGGGDQQLFREDVEDREEGLFPVQRYSTSLFEFTGLATDAGKHVEVVGNAELFSEFHHYPEVNTFADGSMCLLASCVHVIRQFDIKMGIKGNLRYPTENDLAHRGIHAVVVDGLHTFSIENAPLILQDFGIRASFKQGCTLKDLAEWIEGGRSSILYVSARRWNASTEYIAQLHPEFPISDRNLRHVITPTAVVYNLPDRSIAGFISSDSGLPNKEELFSNPSWAPLLNSYPDLEGILRNLPHQGKLFVSAEVAENAWEKLDTRTADAPDQPVYGVAVVSDEPYSSGGKIIPAPIIPRP